MKKKTKVLLEGEKDSRVLRGNEKQREAGCSRDNVKKKNPGGNREN